MREIKQEELRERKTVAVKRALNLGCGFNKKKSTKVIKWHNIDCDASVNPDIQRELERGLPFDDNTVDEIYAHHILEHLHPKDFIFVLGEIYRVCKSKALIEIEVPLGIVDDPTHKTFFAPSSFDHWCEPLENKTGWRQDYYGKNIKFKKLTSVIFNAQPKAIVPCPILRIILEVLK